MKDQTRFEKFFKAEYHKLVQYIRKNLGKRYMGYTAEDLAQDVALGIWLRLDVDGTIGNLAGYVYRSVTNRIIDDRRKPSKHIPIDHATEKINGVAFKIQDLTESDDITEVFSEHDYALLYECISKLKPDEKAILIETEFKGKTFKELSAEWGEPIGTLLSKKHRAIGKLSKMMQKRN